MTEVEAFERELSRVLAATAVAPCPIDAAELRADVVEYLDDFDDELRRFPDHSRAHWNLWLWDELGEPDRDAFFAVVVVRPDGLKFVFGYGRQQSVRDFADSDFPDDTAHVIPGLARRFAVPRGSPRVPRPVAEVWLGRGLGLPNDAKG